MAFIHKGKTFSIDRLRLNLIKLIDLHIKDQENQNLYDDIPPSEISKNPSRIINKYIHYTWNDANGDEKWNGKIT